ncbi:MAG: YggS family pyridoxal phosphate-dependent enzyme [Steroidobacteraceae bacterium]
MNEQINIIEHWQQVRDQLWLAARDCGRDPAGIQLLAVSKQHSAELIRTLALAGQRDFGESYAQEAQQKMAALAELDLTWHFIGQLQSNKTRLIAEHFAWLHTLDNAKHASRLHAQRPPDRAPLQVCIQVKLAEETGKGGISPQQIPALAAHITQLSRLKLRGLMCIPPPVAEYAAQLAQFQRLSELLRQLNAQGMALDTLSMGMSDDYPAAIAAGATLIRVGTAIFGKRS